jgi:hypothetical protein
MSDKTRARMDRWLERWASRKLVVWATATAFLAMDKLGSDEWVAVALAYIGIEGLADIASRWKHGDNR